MKSRRHDTSHHVYLLDTMNNVLGIFILVLILTQILGVSESGLTGHGETDIARLKEQLAGLLAASRPSAPEDTRQAESDFAQAVSGWRAREMPTATPFAKASAMLHDTTASAVNQFKAVKSLAYLEDSLVTERQALAAEQAAREKALQELKAYQDAAARGGNVLDVGQGKPANDMILPDTLVTIICQGHRAAILDLDAIGKFVVAAFKAWQKDPTTPNGWASFANYINVRDCGNPYFNVQIQALPANQGIVGIVVPRDTASWASIKTPEAEKAWVQTALPASEPRRSLIRFLVYGDSFENFGAMRQTARAAGFRTAWVPYDSEEPLIFLRLPQRGPSSTDHRMPADAP